METGSIGAPVKHSGLGGALRDTAIYFFAQLAARGLSFVFYLVLASSIPVDEFGYLNLALVIVILIDMTIDIGLSRFASREVAKNPGETPWVLRLFLPYKISAALVAVLLVWLSLQMTSLDGNAKSIMLVSALGLFLTAPSMLVENVLQAHHRFKLISLSHVALSVSQAALGFAAIWFSASTPVIAWVFVAANAIYLAVLLFGLRNIDTSSFANSHPRSFISCLPSALPFLFGSIVMVLSTRIEFLVLSWYGSPAELGVYGVVTRIAEVALLVPMALGSVLLPRFAASHAGSRGTLTHTYASGLQLLLSACIPASAVVWTFAFVLPMILSKPELGEIGVLARFHFLGYPCASLFVLNTFLLLGASRQRAALSAWGMLVVFQLLLNIILQRNFGIHGAVAASVIFSVVGAVSTTLLICRKYVDANEVFAAALPCIAAGALLVVLIALLSPANPALALAAALAIYAFLIWKSGMAKRWVLAADPARESPVDLTLI